MSAGTKTKELKPMMRAARVASKHLTGNEKQDIADYVLSVRKKLGMTPEEFAELLGVGYSTVRHWETSVRKPRGCALGMLVLADKMPDVLLETQKIRLCIASAISM